jgi:hypothetical protein
MRFATVSAAALLVASTGAMSQDISFLERNVFTPGEGTLPSSCNVDDAVNQPLVVPNFGTAFTSDAQFNLLSADNATAGGATTTFPAGEVVSEIVVWGIQTEFAGGFTGNACDPNQADFIIGTWTDNAGAPDVLVDSATVTPSVADTGVGFFGNTNVQEITLSIPEGLNADGTTWFSVQREPSPDTGAGGSCVFLWVNNTDTAVGDNQSVSIDLAGPTLIPRTEDTAACVTTRADLPESQPVPTNNPWALLALLVALAGFGLVAVRRYV